MRTPGAWIKDAFFSQGTSVILVALLVRQAPLVAVAYTHARIRVPRFSFAYSASTLRFRLHFRRLRRCLGGLGSPRAVGLPLRGGDCLILPCKSKGQGLGAIAGIVCSAPHVVPQLTCSMCRVRLARFRFLRRSTGLKCSADQGAPLKLPPASARACESGLEGNVALGNRRGGNALCLHTFLGVLPLSLVWTSGARGPLTGPAIGISRARTCQPHTALKTVNQQTDSRGKLLRGAANVEGDLRTEGPSRCWLCWGHVQSQGRPLRVRNRVYHCILHHRPAASCPSASVAPALLVPSWRFLCSRPVAFAAMMSHSEKLQEGDAIAYAVAFTPASPAGSPDELVARLRAVADLEDWVGGRDNRRYNETRPLCLVADRLPLA
jgi:hypothetical protein